VHKYIKPTLCALLVCGMPKTHPCCTCFARTSDYIPIYLPLSSALTYLPVVNHPSPKFLTSHFSVPTCLPCIATRVGGWKDPGDWGQRNLANTSLWPGYHLDQRFSTFVTLWTPQKFQARVADPPAQSALASTFRTPGWARRYPIKIAYPNDLNSTKC